MSMTLEMKSKIVKATKADRSPPSRKLVPGNGCNPGWDSLFDAKFVLAYTGYPTRVSDLKHEFARVGMTDVEIVWNTDDKFAQEYFRDSSRHDVRNGSLGQFRFFNNGLGHYRIIKGAYQRGLEHILVMEDDIRFLRDKDKVQEILAAIPSDYEVALLDSHGAVDHGTGSFWRVIDADRSSAGCYALSRDGMAKMIAYYETKPFQCSDMGFTLDNFDRPYFCYPLIARQAPGAWWSGIYDTMRCDWSDYGE